MTCPRLATELLRWSSNPGLCLHLRPASGFPVVLGRTASPGPTSQPGEATETLPSLSHSLLFLCLISLQQSFCQEGFAGNAREAAPLGQRGPGWRHPLSLLWRKEKRENTHCKERCDTQSCFLQFRLTESTVRRINVPNSASEGAQCLDLLPPRSAGLQT